jgi:hypothetical protein
MFDPIEAPGTGPAAPTDAEILGWLDRLHDLDGGHTDTDCIDRLTALERLKSAAAAAQARVTGDLETARRADGRPHTDHGLGGEVALARQESPHHGRAHLALSRALLHDLPHTLAAHAAGDHSDRRAQIIATERAEMRRPDRFLVDAELAGQLTGLGDLDVQQATRRIVLRIDEEAVLRRRQKAHNARHVSGRVLPDGTAQVTGIVSDVAYAAILNSLARGAARARAAGDDRTRGQLMADLFVARLTGQVTAQSTPVAVQLVVSAETLLGDSSEPAQVPGAGHVPATVARAMVAASPDLRSTLQRVFHFPETGHLVALEHDTTRFPPRLRDFIRLRDQQRCRTPWCTAPARHTDHPNPLRNGGTTTAHNGQDLCEACNYAKESPGWQHQTTSHRLDQPHTTQITTPTGHTHRSREPGLPIPRTIPRPRTRLEAAICNLILTV